MRCAGFRFTVKSQLVELAPSVGSVRPDRAHAVGRLVDSLAKKPAVLFISSLFKTRARVCEYGKHINQKGCNGVLVR